MGEVDALSLSRVACCLALPAGREEGPSSRGAGWRESRAARFSTYEGRLSTLKLLQKTDTNQDLPSRFTHVQLHEPPVTPFVNGREAHRRASQDDEFRMLKCAAEEQKLAGGVIWVL